MRATQLAFFSVVAIVLVGVGAYAVGEFRAPVEEPGVITPKGAGEEEAELACPEPDAVPLSPAEVTVTVLNGTGRSGLAGETSEQLGERGYTVGDPGNTVSPAVRPRSSTAPRGTWPPSPSWPSSRRGS
ncbi:LytR C-terminal domain-containing protein [Brachybacterium sacelli]|uniref:LytR C-terminal domain-containing protein n=1 Tax=Brachybacterium sacelli TaxID=173364 RepID=UPI00361BECB6